MQLGVEEKIFLLKFKTEDEANDFATRADALKGKWQVVCGWGVGGGGAGIK